MCFLKKLVKTHFKQRSLSSLIKWTILIFIPIIITGFFVVTFVYINNRSQAAENYKNSLDYQTSQFSNILNRVNLYVMNTLLYNENTRQITENNDPLLTNYFSNRLIEDLNRTQGIVGYDYNFFYYNFTKDIFLSTPSGALSYGTMQRVNDALLPKIIQDRDKPPLLGEKKLWSLMKLDDSWYIFKYFQYQDRVLGCWIKGDNALSFINSVTSGNEDFYTVLDSAGSPVRSIDRYVESGIRFQNGLTCFYYGKYLVYQNNIKETDFSIVAASANIQGFKDIAIVEIILLVLMGIIIITGAGLLLFLKKEIVEPVQYFYNNLNEYKEKRQIRKGLGFVELEQAVDKFDTLAQQIRKLKIDIYEEKINRQKTELEYLQMQIKPHFFINCLNMIYGMAENRQYIKIQKLVLKISEFLRYYFQNSFEKVTLEDELMHVQGYVDILKIQFGSEFVYENEIENGIMDYLIPPLLILTMVENSIKHNIFQKENIKITVSARLVTTGGGEKVRIEIADNGAGMDPEIMTKLNNGENIAKSGHRRHIGIPNTVRRLNIMYGDQADIRFSNTPEGGCIVAINIPPQKKDEESLLHYV